MYKEWLTKMSWSVGKKATKPNIDDPETPKFPTHCTAGVIWEHLKQIWRECVKTNKLWSSNIKIYYLIFIGIPITIKFLVYIISTVRGKAGPRQISGCVRIEAGHWHASTQK